MTKWKQIIAITIDEKTKMQVDTIAKNSSVSRSAIIRQAINFYLKNRRDNIGLV